MTAMQAGQTTISGADSTTVVSPRATFHALLYSEIEINCSITVNGLDGSNTDYRLHHPGQGDLVLSVGTDGGSEPFTTVYVKRINSDSGLVELKPITDLGELAPGQFVPAGRVTVEVDTVKSYLRLNAATPGTGATNTAIVLFDAAPAEDTGDAFTLTTDADDGSKVTINTGFDGQYLVSASVCSGVTLGMTAYLMAGTVNNTLDRPGIRAAGFGLINEHIPLSTTMNLAADDEVYVFFDGALVDPNSDDNDNQMTICGPL